MTITILDPTVAVAAEKTALTPRLTSLDGATIGLFDNSKLNAGLLLELVGKELATRYALAGTVTGKYQTARGMKRDEWIGIEACDAIVLANGD